MEATGARFDVRVSRDRARVVEAQRLRYRVLTEEQGARPALSRHGLDEDRFDIHCEHLIVGDAMTGAVVATYRILAPDAARRAGGYCAEESFDIALLDLLRDRMVEVSRACVHPEYRAANVMLLLWSTLARYLVDHGYDYVLGATGVGTADGGHQAASIYRSISQRSHSPDDLRVLPRRRLAVEELNDTLDVRPPPLLRAYVDLGAWICGEPAKDREHARAHFPMLLPLARMRERYARRFLAKAA